VATVVADSAALGAPISKVHLVVREIFEPVPEGPFSSILRLANTLHVRSRDATVRSHLLFRAGDRWDPEVARENARNMRALEFLEPLHIGAKPNGDSVVVTVETRDVWSTLIEFDLEGVGGEGFGSVAFSERNLFGFGKEVTLSYNETPGGVLRGGFYRDPAVGASRVRMQLSANTGSAGIANAYYLGVPFYSIETPRSVLSEGSRVTSVARLYQGGDEVAHFDRKEERILVTWGERLPVPESVWRLWGSFFLNDRRFGPTVAEPGAPPEFVGGEENLRIRRLSAVMQLWQPNYVERLLVDRMGSIEDYDLGPGVTVEAGYSPQGLGGTADEGFVRVEADAGGAAGPGFGWLQGSVQARLRERPEEVVGTMEARWVQQGLPAQTLVLSALGIGSYQPRRDFQVIFGGLNGLRASPVHGVVGQQGWRFNVEDRVYLRGDVLSLLRVGAAGFYDVARTWGLGSGGAGWFNAVGAGLRLAVPRISPSQVLRIDVAWPLSPDPEGRREPVFTFGSRQAF
jgi:hypothetical protein